MLSPADEYAEKVESWGVRWIETPLDGTGINPVQDLKYLLLIYKIFRKENPDVILSFTIKSNIYSCLAASMNSMPVICNVSGLGTVFLVKGITGRIAMMLYKLAFRHARYIFFQNQDDQELFTNHIQVKEEKRGLLPGSGINLDEYPYTKPPFGKPLKILMISRLIIEKGVREFAEAASFFADRKEVAFTLVGKFDENHSRSIDKAELERWIDNDWISYLPHSNKIKDLIASHEVVILPSYREGTPRTLLESAAMGRPLMASNVPGCKEVVMDGNNGFLFEVKNAKSMMSKVKLYMSLSEAERTEMSLASRSLVEEKFDEKLVIKTYDAVICRILDAS